MLETDIKVTDIISIMKENRERAIARRWRIQMQRGYLKLATLFVLTRGPLHGYQIIKEVSEATSNLIKPTPGTLYPMLKQLHRMKLISMHIEGRRKIYSLTDKGWRVLRCAVMEYTILAAGISRSIINYVANILGVNGELINFLSGEALQKLLLTRDKGELKEVLAELAVRFRETANKIDEVRYSL